MGGTTALFNEDRLRERDPAFERLLDWAPHGNLFKPFTLRVHRQPVLSYSPMGAGTEALDCFKNSWRGCATEGVTRPG